MKSTPHAHMHTTHTRARPAWHHQRTQRSPHATAESTRVRQGTTAGWRGGAGERGRDSHQNTPPRPTAKLLPAKHATRAARQRNAKRIAPDAHAPAAQGDAVGSTTTDAQQLDKPPLSTTRRAANLRRAAGRAAARKTEDSILSGRVNTLKRPTSDVNDNRLRL